MVTKFWKSLMIYNSFTFSLGKEVQRRYRTNSILCFPAEHLRYFRNDVFGFFPSTSREVFGVSFKIAKAEPSDVESTDLIFSCLGIGYVNVNRTLA